MAQLGKECVVVTDHWPPFPRLLGPTNAAAADAAREQVLGGSASLRLHLSLRTPDVESAVPWQVFRSHTFSHNYISKTGERGIIAGTDRGERRKQVWEGGRQKENQTDIKARARKNRTTWEAAQQKGPSQQEWSVIPFEKLRHPEMLLKGNSEQWHYWATLHGFAKYNYQVLLTFPGGRTTPFSWSRPSVDVIDLTLRRLLTTQMHASARLPLFLSSFFFKKIKMHFKILHACKTPKTFPKCLMFHRVGSHLWFLSRGRHGHPGGLTTPQPILL